jgi:putative toxin-antitoxin system antitoxin component (TIGR02293 family)
MNGGKIRVCDDLLKQGSHFGLYCLAIWHHFVSMKRKFPTTGPASARVQDATEAAPGSPTTRPGFESIEEIREGLPVSKFFELEQTLGVGTAQLAEVVGIPVRTLQRRKDEGRLTKTESDRVDRVFQLVAQATKVFESVASAREWLTRPQLGLAGFVPLDLADTGAGIREVEHLLGRIDYGVYA